MIRFIFCCKNIVIAINKGHTPSIKKDGGVKGKRPNKLNIVVGSGAERSLIHPKNGACLISIVTYSTLYMEKNTGIWTSNGKQPDTGLIFSFLYSNITSHFVFNPSMHVEFKVQWNKDFPPRQKPRIQFPLGKFAQRVWVCCFVFISNCQKPIISMIHRKVRRWKL